VSLLNRLRRGGHAAAAPPAPFVVGLGRSGTTLLRLMLDSHPRLAIGPETGFVPELVRATRRRRPSASELVEFLRRQRTWGDFDLDTEELERRLESAPRLDAATALRTFYGLYAEGQGKPRWGDKTPVYVKRMRMIAKTLPEARFIHVIRDGRDVALARARRAANPATPQRAAETWRKRIGRAREQARGLDHYIEVRYEDLVTDTERTLRRVAAHVELPFDDAMLRYYERAPERLAEISRDLPAVGAKGARAGSERAAAHALAKEPPNPERIAAWREQMSDSDRAAYEAVAGDLLAELGYEVG
jgi:hypothetical protein